MRFESERQIDALLAIYREAEARLTAQVVSALRSGNLGTATYRTQQLALVEGLLSQVQGQALPQALAVLRVSYGEGLAIANLAGLNTAFTGIHTEAVNILADSLSNRLGDAFTTVGRQVEDIYRKEGLRLSALSLAEGSTRVEASESMIQALTRQGITGFEDRAGREWGLSRYSSMVLRTTTREAMSEGTKNRLIEAGMDLVEWTGNGENCPECAELEGTVYSLTGETGGYEEIVDMPPLHPNCTCVLTPPEVTLDELERQLNGEEGPSPIAQQPETPASSSPAPDAAATGTATAANVDQSIINNFGLIKDGAESAADAIKGVNPLYSGSDVSDAVAGNCQKVTAAVEMRMRGIDAVAALGNPTGRDLFKWFENLGDSWKWDRKITARIGERRFAQIQDEIAATYPIGSRGSIAVQWRGSRSGHIFNWERGKDGVVRFWDGQPGGAVPSNSSVWTNMGQRYGIMRLDDKRILGAAENALTKREVIAEVKRELAAFDKAHPRNEFAAERAAALKKFDDAMDAFRAAAGKPGAAAAATDLANAKKAFDATEASIKRKLKAIKRQRTAIRAKAAK
jgi:hypothetical protein